jgi:hypothetical protein
MNGNSRGQVQGDILALAWREEEFHVEPTSRQLVCRRCSNVGPYEFDREGLTRKQLTFHSVGMCEYLSP